MNEAQRNLFRDDDAERPSLRDHWAAFGGSTAFPTWLNTYVLPFKRLHPEREYGDWCPWDCAACNPGREHEFTPM